MKDLLKSASRYRPRHAAPPRWNTWDVAGMTVLLGLASLAAGALVPKVFARPVEPHGVIETSFGADDAARQRLALIVAGDHGALYDTWTTTAQAEVAREEYLASRCAKREELRHARLVSVSVDETRKDRAALVRYRVDAMHKLGPIEGVHKRYMLHELLYWEPGRGWRHVPQNSTWPGDLKKAIKAKAQGCAGVLASGVP